MNISSIIAEYNPMHKGHIYHINKTKEISNSEGIICIMSGNYVQRGGPSIVDKWSRTKAALESGVDLVIELPVVYSLSSAEFFAFGAVSLINSLGVVDTLSFGSELGKIDFINEVSKIILEEPKDYIDKLRNYLDKGYTYPYSRSKALIDYLNNSKIYRDDTEEILSSSNNILAIEYCKSLLKLNSSIKPLTIRREGGSYNSIELNEVFSSATSIRKFLKENHNICELYNHIPEPTAEVLKKYIESGRNLVYEEYMFPYIKYKCLTSENNIKNIPDASEGIYNKIFKVINTAENYTDLISNIKSKRYTYTRISRILSQYFIGFELFNTKELRNNPCPYARVLGFNDTGIKMLKYIKGNSSIPVYTKLPKKLDECLKLDIQATNSYSLLNKFVSPFSDYLTNPIKLCNKI
ncbi:hypothetical protein HMPREF1982_02031 [Clostridiales bacterium oral taxon 876 str. F0540]|nr:hypothetical protein HMPREF1982_02031 [Clostridiales bacterium oral taxon 876 str. F0540]